MAECRRRELGKAVCKHDLLEQSGDEHREPAARQQRIAPVALILELRDHLGVVDQRAGDQVGKERDEQRVAHDVALGARAAHHVDEIGDLLECEERDRNRQHDRPKREMRSGKRIQNVNDEHGILEIAEKNEIERHTRKAEQPFAAGPFHRKPDAEIHRDRGNQQRKKRRPPGGVEDQR